MLDYNEKPISYPKFFLWCRYSLIKTCATDIQEPYFFASKSSHSVVRCYDNVASIIHNKRIK